MNTDKRFLAHLVSADQLDFGPDLFSGDNLKILLALSQNEGLGPLLYWRLSKSGYFSLLSSDIRDALRSSYAGTWMQNRNILKELEKISSAFEQAEIPVVVLKGACFALTLYEDIGLRPMGDLDILVPVEKFSQAVQIAQVLGYEDNLPQAAPGLRDLLNHEVCLQKPGQSFSLEIHHSLVADKTYTYAVPVDWFWEQIEPLTGAEPGMRFGALWMLSPEAQLLYAASHAMLQHGGDASPLRWFYDMDQLVRKYQDSLDWDLLSEQARVFAWGSALLAALERVREYFDTPIPADVLSQLSAFTDRHHDLVRQKQTRPATHTLQEYQKFQALDWNGRFRFVWALAFPAPAYMYWRYDFQSVWLLPWYYLVRMVGIFKDGVLTVYALLVQFFSLVSKKR